MSDDSVTTSIDATAPATSEPARKMLRVRWSRWLLFSFSYGFIGLAMGMDSTFDLRNYHFFNPFWVFVDGMHGVAPAGQQSFLNPLISAPFYFGARYIPAVPFQFFIGAIQGLAGPLLYLIARELRLSRFQALVTAICGMFGATALSEVGNAQGDTLIAPLLLLAFLLILRTANYSQLSRWTVVRYLVGAGLLVGASVGLKETVVCVGLGIAVFSVAISRSFRGAIRSGLWVSAGIVVGWLITYGWWGAVLWTKYGTPVFPMYNEWLHSPWAQPTKNVGWDRSLHGLSAMVLYPFRIAHNGLITGVVQFRELAFPILESLFGVAVVVKVVTTIRDRTWKRSDSHLGALAAFFVTAYVVWCWTTGIYRYVVVMEMLTPILLFLTIGYLLKSVKMSWLTVPLSLVVILTVMFSQRVPDWGRTRYSTHYFHVAVPAALNHSNNAIVIVGDAPSAFIIPYFDAKPTFIRSGRVFPLVGKSHDLSVQIVDHAAHTFVVWGDGQENGQNEDTLTWQGVITDQPYPQFLSRAGLGTTSTSCGVFPVTVNSFVTPFHYCQVR